MQGMLSVVDESPMRDQLLEVDSTIPESDYAVTAKGTLLPRSTRVGGIAGRSNPYPPATLRTFTGKGLKLVKEEQVVMKKGNEQPEITEEDILRNAGVFLEDEPAQEAFSLAKPAAPEPQVDLQALIRNVIRSELSRAVPQRSRQPEPEVSWTSEHLPDSTQARPAVEVTFEGKFGTVTAPMERVIANKMVVVLCQAKDAPFKYQPPVSEDAVFSVSWKEGRETHHVEVKNFGISFDYDNEVRMLVLLPES